MKILRISLVISNLVFWSITLITFALVACSSNDEDETTESQSLSLNVSGVSLYHDSTYVITANKTISSWSSDDEEVATISSRGVITAIHVGETQIKAYSGIEYASCQVEVKPLYTIHDDLLFDWTLDIDDVLAMETRKHKSTSIFGSTAQDKYTSKSTTLWFYGESDNVYEVAYNFSKNVLKAIYVYVTNSEEEVLGFLDERYYRTATTGSEDYRWQNGTDSYTLYVKVRFVDYDYYNAMIEYLPN